MSGIVGIYTSLACVHLFMGDNVYYDCKFWNIPDLNNFIIEVVYTVNLIKPAMIIDHLIVCTVCIYKNIGREYFVNLFFFYSSFIYFIKNLWIKMEVLNKLTLLQWIS